VQFSVQNDIFDNVILPTFSVPTGSNYKVRCLLDTASQSSFITDETANRLNLTVIEPALEITVLGFNDRKKYISKLVTIDLIINDKAFNINALTVPKIRTANYMSQLSEIENKFIENGYIMADNFLKSNPPQEIEILLGMDNAHVLDFNTVSYGSDVANRSCFLSTCIGAIPLGNCADMSANLCALVPKHNFANCCACIHSQDQSENA
jgi:hypothetical protein